MMLLADVQNTRWRDNFQKKIVNLVTILKLRCLCDKYVEIFNRNLLKSILGGGGGSTNNTKKTNVKQKNGTEFVWQELE